MTVLSVMPNLYTASVLGVRAVSRRMASVQ
jgi:hypothetical protein